MRMWFAEITRRLLLATHHGLARAFRCQLFVGVCRLELEVREIHGQDAALVETECAQGNVVPPVFLKYEQYFRHASQNGDAYRTRFRQTTKNGGEGIKDRYFKKKQVYARDPTNHAPTSLDVSPRDVSGKFSRNASIAPS